MKNKKPLIALIVLLLIAGVGVTFAYFTSSKTIANIFKIGGDYSTTIEENFTPENDWLPGEEVTKEVFVTNTGNISIVARVKYQEVWDKGLDGNMPNDPNTRVAIINFVENSEWVLHTDGYYYYNKVIPKGTKTSSFIESVTLNPDLDLNSTYIDATYTLNITVDTIQADGATDEWGITSSVVSGL